MDLLEDYLLEICQCRIDLSKVNWNEVLLALHNLNTSGQSWLDFCSLISLMTNMFWDKTLPQDRLKQKFFDLIWDVPLPNPNVSIVKFAVYEGVATGIPTTKLTLETVGKLMDKICKYELLRVEGWPVVRKFGQNSGQYQSNKGLRITLKHESEFTKLLELRTSQKSIK